jgi:hypothetical protein
MLGKDLGLAPDSPNPSKSRGDREGEEESGRTHTLLSSQQWITDGSFRPRWQPPPTKSFSQSPFGLACSRHASLDRHWIGATSTISAGGTPTRPVCERFHVPPWPEREGHDGGRQRVEGGRRHESHLLSLPSASRCRGRLPGKLKYSSESCFVRE